MKAILISIKPEFVAKILNGEKTLEIRKTCPEIFKRLKPYEGCSIDVYIYCTKGNKNECLIPDLQPDKVYHSLTEKLHRGVYSIVEEKAIWNDCKKYILNGKVVAKFTLNRVGNFSKEIFGTYEEPFTYNQDDLLKKSCLTEKELDIYLKGKVGYAWHIDKLKVFQEPRELSSFLVKSHKVSGVDREGKEKTFTILKPIVRAPQSWCYVEE